MRCWTLDSCFATTNCQLLRGYCCWISISILRVAILLIRTDLPFLNLFMTDPRIWNDIFYSMFNTDPFYVPEQSWRFVSKFLIRKTSISAILIQTQDNPNNTYIKRTKPCREMCFSSLNCRCRSWDLSSFIFLQTDDFRLLFLYDSGLAWLPYRNYSLVFQNWKRGIWDKRQALVGSAPNANGRQVNQITCSPIHSR